MKSPSNNAKRNPDRVVASLKSTLERLRLVTGTTGLGDDTLELVDLLLGTTEGTELGMLSILASWHRIGREVKTYPLLGELTGTLVPGVAEQLDHTLLIGSETVGVQSQY